MIKNSLILFLVLCSLASSYAQEVLTGLSSNPLIEQAQQNPKKELKSEAASVLLPFFDDFTYSGPYPSAQNWEDSAGFVNTSYPFQPTNRGVVTLDALDKNGEFYIGSSSIPFYADTLTSNEIRLDSILGTQNRPLTIADSIYFSFFYQPGGVGNRPNSSDSLFLEFFVDTNLQITYETEFFALDTVFVDSSGVMIVDTILPARTDTISIDSALVEVWDRVWSSPGMSLDTFNAYHGHYFNQTILPIADSARFYRKDFKFRFRNIASLTSGQLPSWQGNMDQWNIDYVYLNYGRALADTVYKDVSFVNSAPSFLKGYTSMPYSQFLANPYNVMKDSVDMLMTNLDDQYQYTTYRYEMTTDDGSVINNGSYPTSGTELGENLPPFFSEGYLPSSVVGFRKPPVVTLFPPYADERDSATYFIKHYLKTDVKGANGDSVIYEQNFKNYFSYDDGVPEAGYGLTPSGAKLALVFEMNKPDTLRAVDIYFNRTLENVNLQYFNLAVWSGNVISVNGVDSLVIQDLVYVQQNVLPKADLVNGFQRFYLSEPVSVGRTFFVGTIQSTDYNLNIGFDRSRPLTRKALFQIDNLKWYYSQYSGALMIRPIVGAQLEGNEYAPQSSEDTFIVGPNPLRKNSQKLSLYLPSEIGNDDGFNISVYSIMGQLVFQSENSDQLDLAHLSQGIYLVRLNKKGSSEIWVKKLIITE